ncbi:hypothetical protein BD410DRAFT_472782 [Rickenella mellea]|uniref:Uncharacterized protein n=1 Tax=Rickenella mellea TaxID=50990 RepID=A0A4Y7QHG3_9AGAM|nr:hypothetical protein BD410DRAFT_472782 [Rickenella mellea]
MIKNWTGTDIQAIAGDTINDASNAMMLCKNLQDDFGNFLCWFEPSGESNKYYFNTDRNIKIIQFHDNSNIGIPLPNPTYLAIHAAFAKVFDASGAGMYIDGVFRDVERIGVLSSDGLSDVITLLNSFQFSQQAAGLSE